MAILKVNRTKKSRDVKSEIYAYKAIVRIKGSKRRSKTFARKTDAINWEREILSKRNRGEIDQELKKQELVESCMTLDQLRKWHEVEYVADRHAPSTKKTEQTLYWKRVSPLIGSKKVIEINPQDIRDVLKTMQTEGTGPNRINRAHSMLNCMFTFGMKNGLFDDFPLFKNPLERVSRLKDRNLQKEKIIAYLSQHEVELLLKHLKQTDLWLYPIIRALVSTGVRFGELRAITKEDIIDTVNGINLRVSNSYCAVSKEIRDTTKGAYARIIPLTGSSASFFRIVSSWKEEQHPVFIPLTESEHIVNKVRLSFREALKEIGIDRHLRLTDLRHTYAIHFLENGGEMYDLQQILGHTDFSTTQLYLAFSKKMSDRARGIVDYQC